MHKRLLTIIYLFSIILVGLFVVSKVRACSWSTEYCNGYTGGTDSDCISPNYCVSIATQCGFAGSCEAPAPPPTAPPATNPPGGGGGGGGGGGSCTPTTPCSGLNQFGGCGQTDSCGTYCGSCGAGSCTSDSDCSSAFSCINGSCTVKCLGSCAGKCAGSSDGCGGTCWMDTCPNNAACVSGSCPRACTPVAGSFCGCDYYTICPSIGIGPGCGGTCYRPTYGCSGYYCAVQSSNYDPTCDSSCTNNGRTTGYSCSDCSQLVTGGTYSTTAACNSACGGGGGGGTTGYSCSDCSQLVTNGTYSSTAACNNACGGGTTGYSCSNCSQPVTGGTYSTTAACNSACSNETTGYSCSDCSQLVTNGTYSSTAACNNACGSGATGYSCSNCNLSFTGGIYSSTAACNAACINNVPKAGWIQTIGSDIRWDKGTFTNPIPANLFASIAKGDSLMPGIIFSGGNDFGPGGVSSTNWQVGQSPAEIFTTNHAAIPTSYNFLKETAKNSGITPAALTSTTFALGISHNIYQTDGDGLTIGSRVEFGSGNFFTGNFIILVDGDLNISANIIVDSGSTVVFSVSGNIYVAPSVTEIEGIYSADGTFHTKSSDTLPDCPVNPDLQLNVAGSVIVNAGRNGGTFKNYRSLCNNDATRPSVTFTERPDFILNYPSLTQQIMRSWQDSPI